MHPPLSSLHSFTPASEDSWRKALVDAADYIQINGWKRNKGGMVHAIATVCVYSKPYTRALDELKKMLGMVPIDWDQSKASSQEEVISILIACSKV